jgi:predicted RecB family nuclease
MSEKKKALIYLRTERSRLSDEELEKLFQLHSYAQHEDFIIAGAEITVAPFDDEETELPAEYQQARQELLDEKIDTILLWHEDSGTPDTLVRDDITWRHT